MTGANVDRESDDRADESTELEDGPEDTEGFALKGVLSDGRNKYSFGVKLTLSFSRG